VADNPSQHHHEHVPLVDQEPFDPANKSLADALQASFRILKLVMAAVVIFFVFSGLKSVKQETVLVRWRLGRHNAVLKPGLHLSYPYPIDELIKVKTAPQTLKITDFWLTLRDKDAGTDLSDLKATTPSLDPARDGALLTGDRALMHVLLSVQYRISEPEKFVYRVINERTSDDEPDGQNLLRPIIRNAAVAEAARTTRNVVWQNPDKLATRIHVRAQKELTRLQTGITLETVDAEKSHYPLQVKDGFLSVINAEARGEELRQDAKKQREEILKSAAGTAWKPIYGQIRKLDQTTVPAEQQMIFDEIKRSLKEDAKGEARRIIELAKGRRNRIEDEAEERVSKFNALLTEYRKSPNLVRQREIQAMLRTLFANTGVNKWLMPSGKLVLYLNEDPVQLREADIRRTKEAAEKSR